MTVCKKGFTMELLRQGNMWEQNKTWHLFANTYHHPLQSLKTLWRWSTWASLPQAWEHLVSTFK